jgi:hypothetical protein
MLPDTAGNEESTWMSKPSVARKLFEFLKARKKWWLTPIIVLLVLMATLIILTEGSALSPFIYALF